MKRWLGWDVFLFLLGVGFFPVIPFRESYVTQEPYIEEYATQEQYTDYVPKNRASMSRIGA